MRAAIRYASVDPAGIFNLCSPRWLPEISLNWQGRRPWHDRAYEPVRDMMEREYIAGFDSAGGHYARLRDSIMERGIRNPVMVSCGKLERRKDQEIPPTQRSKNMLVCEYLGGSRLYWAQHFGILVPCIINDYSGALAGRETLTTVESVLAKFKDRPNRISINRKTGAVTLNDMPYVHLPPGKRYSLAHQSNIRRGIVAQIKASVSEWLKHND